uniref:PPP1R35_C domain-containing protein n=2 Tax=Caenorhabditis tropicalis TaxID=1561998 RepID=A0A1I7TJM7_9PELO
MVQKQVEKEKSLKRKERSVVKSVPRDSVEPLADIKTEGTFVEEPKTKTSETSVAQTSIISHLSTPMATIKSESNDETMMKPPALKTPKEKKTYNKKTAKASRESTPYKNGTPTHLGTVQQKLSRESTPHMNGIPYQGLEHSTVQPALLENKVLPLPPAPSTSHIAGLPLNFIPKISDVKMEITPDPQPVQHFVSAPSTSTYYPQATTTVASQVSKTLTPENARPMKPTDDNIFHHLPERIVKKLNQQLPYDYDLLKAHKRITGIDPIVAESEAVLLPHDWDRQKVMKGLASSLGSSHNVSPTTSRQSSETDSSSSDGNRRERVLL